MKKGENFAILRSLPQVRQIKVRMWPEESTLMLIQNMYDNFVQISPPGGVSVWLINSVQSCELRPAVHEQSKNSCPPGSLVRNARKALMYNDRNSSSGFVAEPNFLVIHPISFQYISLWTNKHLHSHENQLTEKVEHTRVLECSP